MAIGAGKGPTSGMTESTKIGMTRITTGNTESGMKGCRNLGSLSEALVGLLTRGQSSLIGQMA
jgi:hypothetical protein